MDTRILKHYEAELAYLREMGAEFSRTFPKVAGRLGMEGFEVHDPYIERLLEGVAFLTARVQLELDLQYPVLTQNLLEIVYPHYLAPTPSMMVAAFTPDSTQGALQEGFRLPRGTQLRSRKTGRSDLSGLRADSVETACVYRTADDVTLWPLEIAEAEYIDGRGALVAAGLPRNVQARAAIRLRLKRNDSEPLRELPIDSLRVFFSGQGGANWKLHELVAAQFAGLAGRSTDRRADWWETLRRGEAVPKGFEPDEALLPTPRRSFDGYRLLQEYFAMPERYHFIEFKGFREAIERATGSDVDLLVLLREGDSSLESQVVPDAFTLYAVPAVNLFPKRCDRIHIDTTDVDMAVTPDRTKPLDFEIHTLQSVVGIGNENDDDVVFRAFYSTDDLTAAGDIHPAYYMQRRRMRQRTEKERLKGARTSYLGSDMYLALVDRDQAPYGANLDQLAATALCTNRDLPLLLPTGAANLFFLPDGGPVSEIKTPVSPTRPRPTLAQGDTSWRLVSHLSLNYLSIVDTEHGGSANAIRELLGIYAPLTDHGVEKQLEGITGVKSRPIVRRLADEVLSTAVRGLEIKLEVDESFFEGSGVYLLASVLERFFRKYVTVNSFTETVLTSTQRGEIARWRPETGLGRII